MDEEVYLQPPEGYETTPGMVWKLDKALYGLAASPRLWYGCITKLLMEIGFKPSLADPCIFVKKTTDGIAFISLYVDDLVITGNDKESIHQLKEALRKSFEMKDLGDLSYCLGMEINRTWNEDKTSNTTKLTQVNYLIKMLAEFGMLESTPTPIPMSRTPMLTKKMCPTDKATQESMEHIPYRRACGKLLYLALNTRPDIMVAVSLVSKFCENPGPAHWTAVKRIFRYLNGTRSHGLTYSSGGGSTLIAYADADWAGDRDDCKSRSGFAVFLGGNLISWKSKRQGCTSLSTAEAEYISLNEAGREVVWLRNLLNDMNFPQKGPTLIHEDNTICIHMGNNPVTTDRQKHIDIRYHWIRETIEKKLIYLQHCKTEDMVADVFTKPLDGPLFSRHRVSLKINA